MNLGEGIKTDQRTDKGNDGRGKEMSCNEGGRTGKKSGKEGKEAKGKGEVKKRTKTRSKRVWIVEGRRAATKDEGGEEKGGREWWDRWREERTDESGETGRLTQSHSCRPDL